MQIQNDTNDRLISIFEQQKKNVVLLRNSSIKERKQKLKTLKKAIFSFREKLQEGIYKDFKKPFVETDISEIYPTISELNHTISHLADWAKKIEVETPLAILGTSSYVQYEAKGNTLIITPWNYPIFLSLSPIISAISAGNTVILKPSEFTPHTNKVLKEMLLEVFQENELAIVEGDYKVSTELLKLKFNHVHFTGSPAVGKIIMKAAAEHLSSCTLELGGKSPSIVTENADLSAAASKIVWGKYLNEGQTCVAPDYILIQESIQEKFIQEVKEEIESKYGKGLKIQKDNNNLCRIINQKNFQRIQTLVEKAIVDKAVVEIGAEFDAEDNFISPTVLTNVSLESELMQEEIFGPIMPIVTFNNISEAISLVQSKEKPLALYIFSKKQSEIEKILKETSSGGVCINDTLLHISNPNLPFGGVNNSGIGKSHGKWGFIDFSNEKSVMKQHLKHSTSKLLHPPYNKWTKRIIDITMKYF